jgi:fructose-1,6-bisphosphatase/inositol monophosphatase family enzyme
MSKDEQSLEFLSKSEYGRYAEEILSFYVPLALSLPQTRDDPESMKETIKAQNASGVTDVATLVDIQTQSEIKKHIGNIHPDWQFWGEEGEDNTVEYDLSKHYLLITDPIEGTNNFKTRKDDQWGSVSALVDIKSKQPVIGIVAYPSRRQFYVGIKDCGAHSITYDQNNEIVTVERMKSIPEFTQFTYNNSPHFNQALTVQVERFLAMGEVVLLPKDVDDLEKSRIKVHVPIKDEVAEFVDPESGALEAVRYRGTIYFKTSNEMAAVFVILQELGGMISDGDGNPWSFGIKTLIAARTKSDYLYLKGIFDDTRGN